MSGDRWYRCIRCGHVGSEVGHDEGQEEARVCVCCGSFEIESCPAPRFMAAAEIEARRWKMRAELLSALIKRAGACGALPDGYVTQASRVMAGTA
ncbi:hypothetical protein [Solidesulfovibrio sp.]|uniref:hypothetical protein n=1 Tax=Solidesulfovibrio sp. TaxID=2910990 RepID=UPI002B211E63|nr:hypothetical protein [Solidesulfovibrio sp.]MEA5087279.1 hypothetical protein [Solidesulfovibrio sp.]